MESASSSKEADPGRKYIWNNNHDSIMEWQEFQSSIKDKLEELGFMCVESEIRTDDWIGPLPEAFIEATIEEIGVMTSIELQRYTATYNFAKDKKLEFQKKVDLLKTGVAKAIAFVRKSFLHTCNAYIKIDEVSQSPLVAVPGVPMSGWREDYRWRSIWKAIVDDFKPMTEENKKYYEGLLKECTDKHQSFACFEGEYKSLMKKLEEMGFPLREEEHRDLIGANVTNSHLVTQKSNYLSKSYDLDMFWKLCRDYLATMSKHDTGNSNNTAVKARSVTFVDQTGAQVSRNQGGESRRTDKAGDSVKAERRDYGDTICFRCSRQGHIIRGCTSTNCLKCGKVLSANERHDMRDCQSTKSKKKRHFDANDGRQEGQGKGSGGGGAGSSSKGDKKQPRTDNRGAGAAGGGSNAASSSGGVAPTASAVVGNTTA